jgi:outer membrane protein
MFMALRFLYSFLVLVAGSTGWALQGSALLQERLLSNHLEIQSFEAEVKAQESIARSAQSGYYPTLNAVGGWQNVDELRDGEHKGPVGYIDGKWNLFRGFRDRSMSTQAHVEFEIRKIILEEKRRSLRTELTEVLSEMVYAHQLEVLLDEENKLTQNHQKMASKKASAGLTGTVDNLEFDLRENEIEIQKRQLLLKHLEAHLKLKTLFGEDIQDAQLEKIKFDDFLSQDIAVPAFDRTRNPSVQKAKLRLDLAEAQKDEARSDFLPSVDFEYRFGHLTPDDTVAMKYNESRYGILLTIPIFSGLETQSKTRAQTFNVAAKEKEFTQSELTIEGQHKILGSQIKELLDLLRINDKRLKVSKKYYELTLGEYKRGVKNSPDVVAATERWFETQRRKFELLKELAILQAKINEF